MNKPFVRDNAIFIPTYGNAFLSPEYCDAFLSPEYCDAFLSPEYCDETTFVAGEILGDRWGFPYFGENCRYRHRATDNPEADLAAVLAVYARNTAPKPKGPYVNGPYLHIPAGSDTLLLSEYVDADVWVAEDTLSPDWGYLDSCREFRFSSTTNLEADLAKVMEVYERNTNKDVVITITKLPPEPHPESGTEIPVPKCRVELGVSIPRAEDFTRDRAVPSLVLFCEDVTPKRWNPDTVRRQVFAADTMSAALALAEAKAKDIRTTVRDYLARVAAYDEKRAAAIAAADAEYERRANS